MRALHDGWTVVDTDGRVGPVPASIPGCVHTDLLAAGLIPDPYLDDNEARLQWIGRTDWIYRTTFDWQPDADGSTGAPAQRHELVCAGLDTVATITLNGTELGRTANMHRSYRFGVDELLRAGENQLEVRFDSAIRYAEQLRDSLGSRPYTNTQPFNFIRKMACNFGWDWGPELVTAGIWRPIGLHSWSAARLAQVRPLISVVDGNGLVELHVEADRAGDAADGERLTVTATVGGAVHTVELGPGERSTVLRLNVRDPALWWPRGYGAQDRYPLEVTLAGQDGRVLDQWNRQIGFRSVRLDTTPDEIGERFAVVVNEVPIMVRGVNWIPDDVFPARVTRDRYRERLDQAVGANVNYLRIWGGGRYESTDLYELADERGLLVGQDFLFACAAYPEESPLREEVLAEAEENVVALASHPSLISWTGNNENIWGFWDWDWRAELAGRSWGAGYYFDLLPEVMARLDPTRPYWPGSPYSGTQDRHPNDPRYGTTHIWDVWNTEDYLKYRDTLPRFVAEFGYQGPPTYATLRRAISDEPLAADSPGMRAHQKAADGDAKLQRGLDAHLPVPGDFDDWHYLTQLNQARAVALGIEHFRAGKPVNMGTIVWQLNDCWPVTSWAAVDGDGRRKPLWFALRRAYADRLLTIQPRDGGLAVVAINETDQPWTVPVTVTRHGFDGTSRQSLTVGVQVAAREVAVVPLPTGLATAGDVRAELLRAEAPGAAPAWWFFAEDRDLDFPKAEFDLTVHGNKITVTAGTLLRDVCLFADRVDPAAWVDDALVTLLPGEVATFDLHGASDIIPLLRCVNDI